MDDKKRCQSCGMPLMADEYLGLNADGLKNHDYCMFCFQNGTFTKPDLTVDGMTEQSIDNMVNGLHISQHKTVTLAHTYIPNLKRWKTAE